MSNTFTGIHGIAAISISTKYQKSGDDTIAVTTIRIKHRNWHESELVFFVDDLTMWELACNQQAVP